jgi:hypothetical protein
LAYYIVRKPETIFRAFGAAWNDVWYDPGDPYNGNDGERLIMTVDINTVDPLCEGFAAPCYYRFNCPAQGYCSQKQSGSCLPACVH